MGLGINLDNVEDFELRASLTRSSSQVNALCSVATLPQEHDFRGGTITGERHEWRLSPYDNGYTPFRFYPWHKPIKEITDFRIYSTPQLYTAIDPDEIFINNSGGYIEVSSLKITQYGILGGVVNALVGMWTPVAQYSYTYGYQFGVTGDVCETTDGWTFRAQNQWWDSSITPEIQKDGVVITTNFTIDYDEGTITFDSAQPANTLITASYTYKLPWQIGEATALLTAEDFGEARMRERGMQGVDTLRVGEIEIRRSGPGGNSRSSANVEQTSPRIGTLLAGFQQITVQL